MSDYVQLHSSGAAEAKEEVLNIYFAAQGEQTDHDDDKSIIDSGPVTNDGNCPECSMLNDHCSCNEYEYDSASEQHKPTAIAGENRKQHANGTNRHSTAEISNLISRRQSAHIASKKS